MNQSGTIAAALLAGFVLYLAARDRLKVYAAVLWGNTEAPLPSHSTAIPGFASGAAGGTSLIEGITGLGGIGGGGGGLLTRGATLLAENPEFLAAP